MLRVNETSYKAKYLKYKSKYLELESKHRMKKLMRGGNPHERLRLIPENFPNQMATVPPYYTDSNGKKMDPYPTRFSFSSNEECQWSYDLSNYEPIIYNSAKIIYHSIDNWNFWNPEINFDENYKENVPSKGMISLNREGWADSIDVNKKINAFCPMPDDYKNKLIDGEISTNNFFEKIKKIRIVNMSAKDEIEFCESMLDKLIQDNKIHYDNDETNKKLKIDCVNKLATICKNMGIKLRVDFAGKINFDASGHPMNPVGRTGMAGRGVLGNWGPNHAADPLVCRINPDNNRLEFALIVRFADKFVALPGGIVEAGQTITEARTREFAEEALGYEDSFAELDEYEKKKLINKKTEELKKIFGEFKSEDILYQGIVDDFRNTDWAWMVTTVILTFLGKFNVKLKAGSDASAVGWYEYNQFHPSSNQKYYANHEVFILLAIDELIKRNLIREEFNDDGSKYYVGVEQFNELEEFGENMELAEEVKANNEFNNKRQRLIGGKKSHKNK